MKEDSVDQSFEKLNKLLKELPSFSDSITTESDTRLKIIDSMITSILGWGADDIQTEEYVSGDRLDYKLSINKIAKIIIEAKRMSKSFGTENRECGYAYKISSPILNSSDLKEAIHQAILYSSYKGAELSCATNGREWVIFRSNRLGDGIDVLDGKVFVFGSIQCILDNFSLFYDLLAKERVSKFTYRALFQEAEGRVIRHSGYLKALRPAETAFFLTQPSIISELDKIMTSFFQRLSADDDSEMVEYCFVETKESQSAEQRLLRLSEDIIGHIRSLDTGSGKELTDIIDRAIMANLNQFILIVGTKGAGKSTFIKRFFNKKMPDNLKKHCVPIIINLADSDGDESNIVDWLRRNVLSKAESALGDNTPTWDEIVGHMFFGEYQRWSTGTMAHLYAKDKDGFKIEFGKHIETIRQNDPVQYLFGLMRNYVRSRKQIPCLVFDNADHFSIAFQERVFSFARSLFEQEVCIAIMPITDKTSWQLSKQGALNSFENEALLLPTPSSRVVLEKRINYVLKKIQEDKSDQAGEYFIGKGIRVNVENIIKFVQGLQEVFLNSDKTSYTLGQLSNHNIRNVLELARSLINSPHIGINDIFKTYVLGSSIFIPDYKIRKALLRGRYDIYTSAAHSYVHNIFELNTEIETTPFLGIRILQTLKDSIIKSGDTKSKYMHKSELYGYLTAMGLERRTIALWLDALLKKSLVINYDPTRTDEESATLLEISPSGELHLFWAKGNYDYIEAMAEVTSVRDESYAREIERASHGYGSARMHDIIRAFKEYMENEDRFFCQIPNHESYYGQSRIMNVK